METDIRKLPLLPDNDEDYRYVCYVLDKFDKIEANTHASKIVDMTFEEFRNRMKNYKPK